MAGPGTVGIFYLEPWSEREPIYSPYPGPAQMCKIVSMVGLRPAAGSFFLELELVSLGRPVWLEPEMVLEPL